MKKPLKSLLIISICCLTLTAISVIYVLKIKEHNVSDITADNYEKMIKPIDLPIYSSGIDQIANEKFFPLYAYQYVTTEGVMNVTQKTTSNGTLHTQIKSYKSGLLYDVFFKNKKAIYFSVANPKLPSTVKSFMDRLITKNGFILKESKLISGNDILIREDEDCFMIATIFSKYDDPTSFAIKAYSKN